MKSLYTCIALPGIIALASLPAHAQFYKIHNGDLSVGAMSPFTTTLTSNGAASATDTNTTGFIFSFKEHPVPWAGIEFNYGYSKYTQRFAYTNPNSTAGVAKVASYNHEATAAYLFHPHFKKLQPFMSVGGGAIDFDPVGVGNHQWRGTGLVELGFDIPTSNPHLGFRLEGRDLIYRRPNFGTSLISTRSWVSTEEPSASVYYRF